MSALDKTKNAMVQNTANNLAAIIAKNEKKIMAAAGSEIDFKYFGSIVMTAVKNNPALAKCDPVSFLGAVLQSLQLKLRLDGPLGFAYLVPFKDQVQFIPGYKGLIELARRSGKIKNITAQCVHAHDEFDFQFGLHETLVHKPATGDRGELTHVYAYAHLMDGGFSFEVMSIDDLNAFIEKHVRATNFGPWKTDKNQMCKKTVIKQLLKYLPSSVEVAKAVELDELASRGIQQGISFENGEITNQGFIDVEETD